MAQVQFRGDTGVVRQAMVACGFGKAEVEVSNKDGVRKLDIRCADFNDAPSHVIHKFKKQAVAVFGDRVVEAHKTQRGYVVAVKV